MIDTDALLLELEMLGDITPNNYDEFKPIFLELFYHRFGCDWRAVLNRFIADRDYLINHNHMPQIFYSDLIHTVKTKTQEVY